MTDIPSEQEDPAFEDCLACGQTACVDTERGVCECCGSHTPLDPHPEAEWVAGENPYRREPEETDENGRPVLKTCPFCKGECVYEIGQHNRVDVKVVCTGCETEGPLYDDEDIADLEERKTRNIEDAAAHWNHRAE